MRVHSATSYSRNLLIKPTPLRSALAVKVWLFPTGDMGPLELGQHEICASLSSTEQAEKGFKWSAVHTFASAQ